MTSSSSPRHAAPGMASSRDLKIGRPAILLVFLAGFLLAPKIDVVSVLRIEDLVFLFVLPFLIWRYKPSQTAVPGFLNWYLAYLAMAIFSALLNYERLGLFGFLNIARQIQYLIWFVVGAQMAAGISERKFRRAMTIVGMVLILWWIGESLGVIPKIGKFTGASGRVTLNTSGPYEISVLVVLLMLFVRNKLVLLGLLAVLLATQSRITIMAALLIFTMMNYRYSLLSVLPVIAGILAIILLDIDLISGSRFQDTLSPLEMWTLFQNQVHNSPLIDGLSDYKYYAYDTIWDQIGDDRDVSFQLRTIRWALIVKSLSASWSHFLFGWGPGAWGAAVDNHYIRFLGEVGVVGLTFIGLFLVSPLTKGSQSEFRFAIIVLMICSLFIDVMTSSKIMSFLWAFLGYTYNARRHVQSGPNQPYQSHAPVSVRSG